MIGPRMIPALIIGSAVGLGAGAAVGIYVDRQQPKQYAIQLLNPQFPAGSPLRVVRHLTVPDNCTPKMERVFHYDDGHPFTLTDAPSETDGEGDIPTTIHMPVGCGFYQEKNAQIGCRWLSGLYPPVGGKSQPVRACVLAPLPIATTAN